ncbi:MAG: hypothetical protein ACKVHE_31195, partial [Planctomycetales bacterium]
LPELRLRTTESPTGGSQRDFRLLPGSAEAGFLLEPLVESREDLIRLWQSVGDSGTQDVGLVDRSGSRSCMVTVERGCGFMFEPELTVEFFDIMSVDGNSRESSPESKMATLVEWSP